MNRPVLILCSAYVIGLLSTAFDSPISRQGWLILALGWALLGTALGLAVPRFWRTGPKLRLWLVAALIAVLAVVYIEVRTPQPGTNDISQIAGATNRQVVTVRGTVLDTPQLTRTGRVRFFFKATQVKSDHQQAVTGKLYVTVPLLQGTGIYAGQTLAVAGILYLPQPVTNPGAFDFQSYLTRQGVFAGLNGERIIADTEPPWGLSQLRSRIIQSQVRFLGSPAGPLLSSMVLGRRAVDLPYDIRDLFVKAGLAHVLAASGFHVSLLLGVVLTLTRQFSERTKLVVGLGTLILYVGLTGVQPSVMRAAIMGVGALVGLVTERKVRRLPFLLLTATLLLLFNPLWIFDLGFQLSFLATLGLIVTLPALQKRLDWLPPAIATLIAIPIAASVWTLPLISYVFNTVVTYSIPVNILTAPLVALISLGGMVSALVGLIVPIAGSVIASLLYYPIHLLIGLVHFFTSLPGNTFAIGKISLGMLILVYGLIGLSSLMKWKERRWWTVGLFVAIMVVVRIGYQQLTLVQITVLAAKEPILIVQNRGKVTLINCGEADTLRYSVLPFLAQQGINQIDGAVAWGETSSDWSNISAHLPIKRYLMTQTASTKNNFHVSTKFQQLTPGTATSVGATGIQLLSAKLPWLQLKIENHTWLLASNQLVEPAMIADLQPTPQVLLLSGQVKAKWLEAIKPEAAIAITNMVDPDTQQQLRQSQIRLYWTGRDGAIQWTPKGGFKTVLNVVEPDS